MAFADPQSVTYNAVATSLPRISSLPSGGAFQAADGSIKLTVSHSLSKRARHIIRLDHKKIAADPLQPSTNTQFSMSSYMVIDVPLFGYTAAEQKYLADALTAYSTASSGARITQLLGGEN